MSGRLRVGGSSSKLPRLGADQLRQMSALWGLGILFGQFAAAAEPTVVVTDTKGAQVALTEVASLRLSLQIDKAKATISASHVAEILKLEGEDDLWKVSLVDAPPLRGQISGDVAGEWALGAYKADLTDVAKLTFTGRSAATSWPEDPQPPVAVSLTLKGGVDLQASRVRAVPRDIEYVYGDPGAARVLAKSTLVVLDAGGANLLMPMRQVRSISHPDALAVVELADGTRHQGVLSTYYSMVAETGWGTVALPLSAIASARVTAERVPFDISDKEAEVLNKLFQHASFPGQIITQSGLQVNVDAFVMEYCNSYSYFSRAGYVFGGKTVSGRPHFGATEGIPCKVGNSLVELHPSRIRALTFSIESRRMEITALDGTTVHASLVEDDASEVLKKYHRAKEGNHYHLLGILGRTDSGHVRVPISELKEIRRRAE